MKQTVRAEWQRTLLVCAKCGKRDNGGFGPDGTLRLAKALRKAVGGGKGRRAAVGVVEVPCLGICPKGATILVDAARPGQWLIVKSGTPIADVADRIGLPGADAADDWPWPAKRER